MTLARLCEHDKFERHTTKDGEPVVLSPDKYGQLLLGPGDYVVCPGGSLLPPDSLVIVKEDGEWPEWATKVLKPTTPWYDPEWILDALWEGSK